MLTSAQHRSQVAIISTGDELVQGRTVDTNAAYIADRLRVIGIEVHSVLTVGDYPERITWAWQHALMNADVVISTGGLGPTTDDLTTETLARVAGVETYLDEREVERIKAYFRSHRRPMPENNLKQATFPVGAEIVPNELGTAAGYRLVIPQGERRPTAIVLPGVPREMKVMLDGQVIPWLLQQTSDSTCILSRTFQTFGMSESAMDEALDGAVDPEVGRLSFRASFPQISARLTVTDEHTQAQRRLDELSRVIRDRLGDALIAEGEVTMEEVVGKLLREKAWTLATAESCSGGLLGDRITNVPGSSTYYVGGVVAYSNALKEKLLGVAPSTLSTFGAVSEETAREMALGVRKLTGAHIGVATTGIAGPDGGTPEKPVGTVAIALTADRLGSHDVQSRMYRLWGSRDWVKILTSQVALDWVRRYSLALDPLASNFGL
ncbi:MAG: competence/damage-inducible protein A, partial [Acidiferrobacterales bacterium]